MEFTEGVLGRRPCLVLRVRVVDVAGLVARPQSDGGLGNFVAATQVLRIGHAGMVVGELDDEGSAGV